MRSKLYYAKRYCWLALACICFGTLANAQEEKAYDVREYGVVGDSAKVNTATIQKLIDDVSARGGGVIRFPAGQYISGTVLLKNNTVLSLEKNAALIGSDQISDYKLVDSFRTGNGAPMGYCFIGAVDAHDVGIIGEGRINGRGKELLDAAGKSKRPFLVRFVRSSAIILKGVHLTNSAAWTVHFFACKNIHISDVSIFSRGLGNNDGFDIDCSQNININNCDISSGDDGLCFKTTWSKMPCRDIVVKGLRISSNHAAIKWGTESMAPFENIKISEVYIYDTHNGGIKMNSVDGAKISNVEISDVVMDNVRTPMLFRLGSRLNVFRKGEDTKQTTGSIDNILVRNVKVKSAAEAQIKPPSGILITGVPGHYITNLTLQNVEISLPGGGSENDAHHSVPEAEGAYPEVSTFGPTIPAYGLWARHVKGLTVEHVSFKLEHDDLRPAFVVQDGCLIQISNSTMPGSARAQSIVRLEDVSGATVRKNVVTGSSAVFVRAEGESSMDTIVENNKIAGNTIRIQQVSGGDDKK
ncbi:MAG TPA: glycosyl hydrolase family 28 protein [Flavisolibacter sp.]